MRIKNIKYSSILLLVACSLFIVTGCTKETELGGGDTPLPEGSVRITLTSGSGDVHPQQAQTKAGESEPSANNKSPVNNDATSENYVKKIQVFFYDSASGELECVRQYLQGAANNEITWNGTAEMVVNRVSKLGEAKDIYVVTNWMAALPAEISVGSSVDELTKQLTAMTADGRPFAPSESTPLLMSGKTTAYTFHEQGQSAAKTATITLHRQMVKIEVKVLLNNTFFETIKADYTFGDAKLGVYNMPSQSFVMEHEPAALPSGSTMLVPFNAEITNSTNTWNYTFYSYENPQTGKLSGDKVQSTYFNLNVPYTKTVGGLPETHNNYYRVYIDDTSDGTNPHKTLRNHHYTVTVTLIGFGIEEPAFDAIHAVTTVTPWVTEELEQELPGKDMTVNKTEITLNGSTMDQSIIARGTTDVDPSELGTPFSAITYPDDIAEDEKGLELSAIYDPDVDKKSIRITIKNSATKIYRGGVPATFYIQYGAYRKLIKVYLSTDRPMIVGYFGGDPTNTMKDGEGYMYPKQLVVASVDILNKKYKTTDTENDVSIVNSIYYGRDMNIAAAALSGAETLANYPAFEYCASLNRDLDGNKIIDASEMVWYLPSQNQLMAMYIFNGGLDTLFTADTYWSATQFNTSSAWYVYFGNGNTSIYIKTSNNKVRCVRDI